MIQSRINWNGDAAKHAIVAAGWDGIRLAVEFYVQKLREVLNVSVRGPKRKGRAPLYLPSRPGEPPHKRTGWLQRHVKADYDKPNLRAKVGIDVAAIYGVYLELGTAHMKARPWLLATLKKYWDKIKALAESAKVED